MKSELESLLGSSLEKRSCKHILQGGQGHRKKQFGEPRMTTKSPYSRDMSHKTLTGCCRACNLVLWASAVSSSPICPPICPLSLLPLFAAHLLVSLSIETRSQRSVISCASSVARPKHRAKIHISKLLFRHKEPCKEETHPLAVVKASSLDSKVRSDQ